MKKCYWLIFTILLIIPFSGRAETLDHWLNRLEVQESGRRTQIIIKDVNGRLSYGCLQFQERTMETYAKKYGFRDMIDKEDLLNCSLQKSVATAMLTDNYLNWLHWKNSVKIIGMPPITKAEISLKL